MCASLGDATHLFYAFGYVLALRSVLGFLGVGFWVFVCAGCVLEWLHIVCNCVLSAQPVIADWLPMCVHCPGDWV